jgi:hypothetical protein
LKVSDKGRLSFWMALIHWGLAALTTMLNLYVGFADGKEWQAFVVLLYMVMIATASSILYATRDRR